jgi:hypothetical protein
MERVAMTDETQDDVDRRETDPDETDAEEREDTLVNSTLTELALMLVFVFALFPAVAVAVNLGGRQVAVDAMARLEPSCFWIPRSDMPHEIGSEVVFLNDGPQTLENTNLKMSDRTGEPMPRSFVQVYWMYTPEPEGVAIAYQDSPEPVGLARQLRNPSADRIAIVLNLDSYQKPYLYRNPEARTALSRALELLAAFSMRSDPNNESARKPMFDLPTHPGGSGTTRVLRREVIFASDWSVQVDAAIPALKEVIETVFREHGCVLKIDVFNYPHGAPFDAYAVKYEGDTGFEAAVDRFNEAIGTLGGRLDGPKPAWTGDHWGTREPFPKFVDDTD